MGTRSYMVLDKATAAQYGARPLSDSEHTRHALVSVVKNSEGVIEKLDSVLAWGYNPQNLQTIADSRNVDLSNIRQTMERTLIREGVNGVTGEPQKKRGRPRKVVDTSNDP